MPETTSFVFVKFGEEPVRVIPTHTTGMLLVNEGLPLLDMRNRPDAMKQALLALTVPQLKEFADDYRLSGISMRGKTSKQDIVRQILARWDEVMAKVEAMVPDFRENARAMTGRAEASTAGADMRPFSGVPHRLDGGYTASDAEETKEKAPVMRLVVRHPDNNQGLVLPVFEGDTPTTIIEQLVPRILNASTAGTTDPDTTRVAMMLKFVKVRDDTVLDSTTPIQAYFDREWGEVRLLNRDGVHDLISAQFCASGHLWMKTTGQDDSHAKMEDGVVLKAKNESTKGCLTVKVGDSIRLYFNYEPSDRIKDVLESMQAKFGLHTTAEGVGHFKLKYLATGSFFEDWEPVHATVAEDEDGGRAELVVSLRGGGKRGFNDAPASDMMKKATLGELKGNFTEAIRGTSVMVDMCSEVVKEAHLRLTKIFDDAEVNGEAVFKQLLLNLPADVLGAKIETSPLLEIFKKTRNAYRVNAIGHDVMKSAMCDLHDLSDEVAGLVETCGLTFEFVASQAFMRPDGTYDWARMKRAVEDAITIKSG